MFNTTKGLVLRETAYKENDKLLTILTQDLGPITAKARGVKRKNSPLRSGCQLLGYSEFTIYERNGYYTINEAEPIRLFTGLRNNLELLSLGSYFAQLLERVAVPGQADPQLLSLILNSLHALETLGRPQPLVKAVFELRMLCIIGYTPMLDGCSNCGKYASWFLPEEGHLLCNACWNTSHAISLSPGVIAAMQHIVACPKQQLFSFSLPEDSLQKLGEATEQFLQAQLAQTFPALHFYKRLFLTDS